MKYVPCIFASLYLVTAMAQAPDNTKVNKRKLNPLQRGKP
jgi:hypothetical protein